jgi:multidrug transporter EmrE-like cation transporter
MRFLAFAALCLLADAAVAVADFWGKKWVLGEGWGYFAAAYVLCNVSVAAWFVFLKLHGDVGKAAAIWNTTGILAAVIIGVVVFGEKMTSVSWMGLAFCLVGVICLGLK